MKPIIIYPKNKDNNVTLIKEEFEKYLEQAYDSGYKDGFSAGLSVNYTPISITPEKPFITQPIPTWNSPIITCDGHNDI